MSPTRMIGPAWHARQGYETCGCGRPQCRKRRLRERRTMRRIEKREWQLSIPS